MSALWLGPMRSKARGLAEHGGPPGWLEESEPAGCDFVRDGRSMPPALGLTDQITCPGQGLIYYEKYTKYRNLLRHIVTQGRHDLVL